MTAYLKIQDEYSKKLLRVVAKEMNENQSAVTTAAQANDL